MKERTKNIIAIVVFYLLIVACVILVNARLENQKIDAEASIIENR